MLLGAGNAFADAGGDKLAQASDFFDAGAAAYKAGQYLVAAEAFQKAYELSPSPSLLFSAAQAYRRQYLADPSPSALHRSISLYRDYLRTDKDSKRREDAVHALEILVPIETRLPAPGDADGAKDAPSAPARDTRLLLSAPIEGAEVSIDDGPYRPAPLVIKTQKGPHRVRVRAAGYDEEQLTVQAVENELVPRHVPLRPKPARLRVTGTSGARVTVDGQVRAAVPTPTPISIEPGAHFVSVTLAGHEPYSRALELGRDQTLVLQAELPVTRRRIAAWSVLSVGAAGALASGVLTGFALARQGEATSLRDQRAAAPLLPDELLRYNQAVAARNDFSRAAAITGGAAALALAASAGLFLEGEPEVVPPSGDARKAPSAAPPRAEFTVGLLSLGARIDF